MLFVIASPFSSILQEIRDLRGLERGVRWVFIAAAFEQSFVRIVLTLTVDYRLLFKNNCLSLSYGAFLDSTAFFHMWIFVIAPIFIKLLSSIESEFLKSDMLVWFIVYVYLVSALCVQY